MGKRSNLYEIYFGPISRKGHGYGTDSGVSKTSLGSDYPLGGNFGIYDEPDAYDVEDVDDDEIPNINIKAKIDGDIPFADIGHKANRHSNYTGAYTNLAEKKHTTTAVQGLSPRMTYRNSNGGRVTKTSFNSATYPIIYQKPRRDMVATQYGTSKAPLPRHDESDDNIMSLDDIINTHERALHKHNINVNRIKAAINEINYIFFDN